MGCSKAVLVVGTILVVLISTTSSSATQPPAASAAPAFAPNEDASPVAPAPSDDCFNSLLNVSDCLTFVEAESNLTTPDKGCCPSLAGLVESNPICLCKLLGSNATSFGVSIDVNKALQLPKACRVSTPPVSLCSAAGVPVGVPTTSEGPGLSPAGGMAPDMSMTPKNGAPSSRGFTKVIFVGLSSAAAMAMAMAMVF